jgi:hypothetical protein
VQHIGGVQPFPCPAKAGHEIFDSALFNIQGSLTDGNFPVRVAIKKKLIHLIILTTSVLVKLNTIYNNKKIP